jgi:MinD-like ATPase involved in chromosome partitioning or flagellar assembly
LTSNRNNSLEHIVSKKVEEVIRDLSGEKIRYRSRLVDNVIAVTGASGGNGASTIMANLAYEFSKRGVSVMVIDLNILFPIQFNYFKVKMKIEGNDLVTFLLGRSSLEDSIENIGEISLLLPHNRTMVDYINCDNNLSSKNFELGLDRMRELFDIVLIDCNTRDITHDVVNNALYKADEIYIIWDENISCFQNVDRIRRNLDMSGIAFYSKVKHVFNKRTNINYSMAPFKRLNIELEEILPYDRGIIEASLNGEIFCRDRASREKTAVRFAGGIRKISSKILENRGYV